VEGFAMMKTRLTGILLILVALFAYGCSGSDTNAGVSGSDTENATYSTEGWEIPESSVTEEIGGVTCKKETYKIFSAVYPVIELNADYKFDTKICNVDDSGLFTTLKSVYGENHTVQYTYAMQNVKLPQITDYEELNGVKQLDYTLYNVTGGLFNKEQTGFLTKYDNYSITTDGQSDVYMCICMSHNGELDITGYMYEKIEEAVLEIKITFDDGTEEERYYKFKIPNQKNPYSWVMYGN
jgi:isopentenyl phosphate kinase